MRLIDRLHAETEGSHPEADEDVLQLMGAVKPEDYQRFLTRTFGFVLPLERSITRTPNLELFADVRRFEKHHLLRRDLAGFRLRADDIDRLPQCAVPMFDLPHEALGWAYVVERSTLSHANLFRHLATVMPGDVAFTSAYLKCYLGAVGENWRAFADSLDKAAQTPEQAAQSIDAAKAAFRLHRTWRRHHDEHMFLRSQGEVREQQGA